MPNLGGRPTKLTQELIDEAQKYLEETQNMGVQALLPTIEGLALKLHINRDTIYDWEKVPAHKTTDEGNALEFNQDANLRQSFSDIVNDIRAAQAEKLIQNSLAGRYNPTIAKLILSGKHNYVEKQETDLTTNGKDLGVAISAAQAEQLIRARAKRSDS
jgi:hypothetical protein